MNETIFFTIWIIGAVSIVSYFFISGKKALQLFPDITTVTVLFEEKGASGRSNDSLVTKAGGASGVLHVVLTPDELWMKTGIFFGWIAKFYRVLNKIKRDQIIRVSKLNKRTVEIHFRDEKGQARSVTLKLRKLDKFIELLGV